MALKINTLQRISPCPYGLRYMIFRIWNLSQLIRQVLCLDQKPESDSSKRRCFREGSEKPLQMAIEQWNQLGFFLPHLDSPESWQITWKARISLPLLSISLSVLTIVHWMVSLLWNEVQLFGLQLLSFCPSWHLVAVCPPALATPQLLPHPQNMKSQAHDQHAALVRDSLQNFLMHLWITSNLFYISKFKVCHYWNICQNTFPQSSILFGMTQLRRVKTAVRFTEHKAVSHV